VNPKIQSEKLRWAEAQTQIRAPPDTPLATRTKTEVMRDIVHAQSLQSFLHQMPVVDGLAKEAERNKHVDATI